MLNPPRASVDLHTIIPSISLHSDGFCFAILFNTTKALLTDVFFFFLNDPAPPEISTLPLHAALPICRRGEGAPRPAADAALPRTPAGAGRRGQQGQQGVGGGAGRRPDVAGQDRGGPDPLPVRRTGGATPEIPPPFNTRSPLSL